MRLGFRQIFLTGRSGLERLSRKELVLQLQRPGKPRNPLRCHPVTAREQAKSGLKGHSWVLSDDPVALGEHRPSRCLGCGGDLPRALVAKIRQSSVPFHARCSRRHLFASIRPTSGHPPSLGHLGSQDRVERVCRGVRCHRAIAASSGTTSPHLSRPCTGFLRPFQPAGPAVVGPI